MGTIAGRLCVWETLGWKGCDPCACRLAGFMWPGAQQRTHPALRLWILDMQAVPQSGDRKSSPWGLVSSRPWMWWLPDLAASPGSSPCGLCCVPRPAEPAVLPTRGPVPESAGSWAWRVPVPPLP